MQRVKITGKVFEIFDSIEELPIVRFHKYNKMLLIDANIGSDLQDFDKHLEKAMIYAKSKTPQKAVVELENLRQNMYFIQQNISPKCMAFAVLVKSINGKECNDMSDSALTSIIKEFENESYGKITSLLEDVKKKIDNELKAYFPSLFEDATIKEYFDRLRRRTLLILQNVINGESEASRKQINDITDKLITYFKPQTFNGKKNFEVLYDKQFENMCLTISQNLHINPKKFSVLEYYNAFEYIQNENKKLKSANKAF